jgi:hypothetical protein
MQSTIPEVTIMKFADPISFNDRRCTFKLPNAYITSQIDLIDVGGYNAKINSDTGRYYPFGAGVTSMILNIYGRNNGVPAWTIPNLQVISTLENLRTNNQTSEDLSRFDLLTGCSLGINTVTQGLSYIDPRADYFRISGQSEHDHYVPGGFSFQLNNAFDDDTNVTGVVRLRDYVPFLKGQSVLLPMANFTIDIEWDRRARSIVEQPNCPFKTGPNAPQPENVIKYIAPNRPTMVYYLLTEQPPAPTAPVQMTYLDYFSETITLPATGGQSQSRSFQLKGPRGMYVQDMFIFNCVDSLDNLQTYPFNNINYCPIQENEKIQMTINGRRFLPLDGVNTPALKAFYFNKTLDLLNVPYASYSPVVDPSGNYIDLQQLHQPEDITNDPYMHNINGGYAPAAFRVEQVFDSGQLDFERSHGHIPATNQALKLLVYYRFQKELTYLNPDNIQFSSS